jgi:hypothetical protein
MAEHPLLLHSQLMGRRETCVDEPNQVAAMKLQRLFKAYVNSILAKLAASDRTEAVTIAIKRGLIRLH